MAGGESSPRLSMVSARVCHSDVHHQRYTHSHKPTFPAFPRYQLTNSHGQLEDGRGKKEGRVLRCYHPHSPWSGTITPLFFFGGGGPQPGRGHKPGILTKLSLPSRINRYRLKNSQLKYSRPEDTGKTQKEAVLSCIKPQNSNRTWGERSKYTTKRDPVQQPKKKYVTHEMTSL